MIINASKIWMDLKKQVAYPTQEVLMNRPTFRKLSRTVPYPSRAPLNWFPDNSAQDNSAQSIYYRFYIKSRFLSALFFSLKLLPFQQFVITPASISAIFFHQFLTITHTVLIGIGLLAEFIILYRPTVLNYKKIIKCIFDGK